MLQHNMNKILKVPYCEDEKTNLLLSKLETLKQKGYLTKAEIIEILRWKSPRPLQRYLSNTEKDIKDITRSAFSTPNDTLKAHILTALHGVNLPAASAILMFYDRKRFPVLDIRVWQQLYKESLVNTNQNGKGFKLKEWEKYLVVKRGIAAKHKLTARNVEKRIFDLDRKTRKGKLY